MGEDSLNQSTSKKKTVKKSTTDKKPTADPKRAPKSKKTPAKKTETQKAQAKKKKPASTTKRSTQKTKASTTAPKQKAVAPKKKKVSMKDLLSKKFDTWIPEKPYHPEESASRAGDSDAPPFVTGDSEAEIERKRKLLFKRFDLKDSSSEKPQTGTAEAASPDSQIPPPPVTSKRSDPMATTLKLCIVGFVLLIAIMLKVSALNQSHYYLKPTDAGVEILQGIFAPMGEDRLILLPGAEKPELIQTVYSKQEIYPFIFNYYIQKADELLEKPGMPDFEGIEKNLDKALPYATTDKLRTIAKARRNNIDVMILLYKTDVEVSKETIPDYEAALEYLKEAQALDVDGSKTDLIKQKTESINTALSKLKAAEEKATEETPKPELEKDIPSQ